MFMVFVQAVGVSLFPMLRRIDEKLLPKLYSSIRNVLMLPMLGVLIFYYPVYLILSYWLPAYSESLHYMALMFPICIFESKIQLLIEPYLKSLRKEKKLLKVNISAVCFSLISSIITVFFNNLNLSVLSIVFILGYRCVALETIIESTLKIKLKNDILGELVMVILFMLFNWFIGGIIGMFMYIGAYLIYMFLHKNKIRETVIFIKKGVSGKLIK